LRKYKVQLFQRCAFAAALDVVLECATTCTYCRTHCAAHTHVIIIKGTQCAAPHGVVVVVLVSTTSTQITHTNPRSLKHTHNNSHTITHTQSLSLSLSLWQTHTHTHRVTTEKLKMQFLISTVYIYSFVKSLGSSGYQCFCIYSLVKTEFEFVKKLGSGVCKSLCSAIM